MTKDAGIFELIRTRLFTAVIGDQMDARGLTRQFLPPEIRGLTPETLVVGRAMPVLEADCCGEVVGHSGRAEAFGLMFQALDDLKPDEVYICTGSSRRYALWGELMSTRARTLGAAGAVVGGFHRDTKGILRLGFPVFSEGSYAQDQRLRGRVVDFRCTIEFPNGARVRPGDVVVGDVDGVLVIPQEDLEDVVALALKKVEGEEAVRQMIEQGQSTKEVFDRTGIM
ncbi:RraA family protein [Arenibaculum pallidiluteum]|uniref:RraA family protein n=1 Tax=Arenibaculum pallidiluteum TaxID=2812559 RepID=UPI001A9690CC|nr:RraA family protein [Arenibaculum pallidiluteum]